MISHLCLDSLQLFGSEAFWEQTVRLHCDTVTTGMEELARELGWRSVFFTDKLQLQKHISRRLKHHTALQMTNDPSEIVEEHSHENQNSSPKSSAHM